MCNLATELLRAVRKGLPESVCEIKHGSKVYAAVCGGVALTETGTELGLILGPAALVRIESGQEPPLSPGDLMTLYYRGASSKCRVVAVSNTGGIIRYTIEATNARA